MRSLRFLVSADSHAFAIVLRSRLRVASVVVSSRLRCILSTVARPAKYARVCLCCSKKRPNLALLLQRASFRLASLRRRLQLEALHLLV